MEKLQWDVDGDGVGWECKSKEKGDTETFFGRLHSIRSLFLGHLPGRATV